MKDRAVAKPNRRLITPEGGGTAYYAAVERADAPVEEGTPLNKATLLTDATATLLELSGDNATVNNAISALANKKANLASPAFTGTPTAPTATVGTNTKQVATTEFVLANASKIGTLTFIQRYTANGTFNPASYPSVGNKYVFRIQGGGGGGVRGGTSRNALISGGGGAFIEVELIITSGTVTCTVGAGGSGTDIAAAMVNGVAGSMSSITYSGNTYSAPGGNAGSVVGDMMTASGGRSAVAMIGKSEVKSIIPGGSGSWGVPDLVPSVTGGVSALGESPNGYGYGGTAVSSGAGAGGGGCVEVYRYV